MTSPHARPTALLTGVGREAGIGAAIASRLAADGWDLALGHWQAYDERLGLPGSQAGNGALVERLTSQGGQVVSISADLADPTAPAELVHRARAELGGLDAMVLSHCESVDSGILDTTVESFDRHFAVNARAGWLLIKAFAESGGSGRILAMTSDHTAGNLPYGASKGALDRIVLAAAKELGPQGITANVINPGPVDTGWMDDDIRRACLQRQPTGRLGEPADIADVVSFLLSPQGQWVNAQLLSVDGGFSYR